MAIINSVEEAFAFVKSKLEIAEKRANDTFPKIQKLNDIKNPPIVNVGISTAFTFDSYYNRNQPFTTSEQVDKKLAEYEEMLAANIKAIEETHTLNIPIIENNKLVKEKIITVMQHIGIPNTYSESYFKTNRSRTKTTDTKSAGYMSDLNRNCLVEDFYQSKITSAKQAFESLKRKAQDEKNRINKEARDKQEAEKTKKSIQALARMQVKYNLTEDSDWCDVLEALDSKCKYFALARALEDQRNDWSEGFDRSRDAIYSFVVETAEDQEILHCLQEIADDEDLCDGRSFRDCEWSYSALYGKVNSELMEDYNSLQEYYSKF